MNASMNPDDPVAFFLIMKLKAYIGKVGAGCYVTHCYVGIFPLLELCRVGIITLVYALIAAIFR